MIPKNDILCFSGSEKNGSYGSYGSDQEVFIVWIKCILFEKDFSFLRAVVLDIAFCTILQYVKFKFSAPQVIP